MVNGGLIVVGVGGRESVFLLVVRARAAGVVLIFASFESSPLELDPFSLLVVSSERCSILAKLAPGCT